MNPEIEETGSDAKADDAEVIADAEADDGEVIVDPPERASVRPEDIESFVTEKDAKAGSGSGFYKGPGSRAKPKCMRCLTCRNPSRNQPCQSLIREKGKRRSGPAEQGPAKKKESISLPQYRSKESFYGEDREPVDCEPVLGGTGSLVFGEKGKPLVHPNNKDKGFYKYEIPRKKPTEKNMKDKFFIFWDLSERDFIPFKQVFRHGEISDRYSLDSVSSLRDYYIRLLPEAAETHEPAAANAEETHEEAPANVAETQEHADGIRKTVELKRNQQLPEANQEEFCCSECEELTRRLNEEGKKEKKVRDDGNCQFRALADQLFDDENQYEECKKKIIEQLRRDTDHHKASWCDVDIARDGPWETYLDRLENGDDSGQPIWGCNRTLQAAADAYGVTVHLYSNQTGYRGFPHKIESRQPVSGQKPVSVSHYAEVHYNSVRPMSDEQATATETEIKEESDDEVTLMDDEEPTQRKSARSVPSEQHRTSPRNVALEHKDAVRKVDAAKRRLDRSRGKMEQAEKAKNEADNEQQAVNAKMLKLFKPGCNPNKAQHQALSKDFNKANTKVHNTINTYNRKKQEHDDAEKILKAAEIKLEEARKEMEKAPVDGWYFVRHLDGTKQHRWSSKYNSWNDFWAKVRGIKAGADVYCPGCNTVCKITYDDKKGNFHLRGFKGCHVLIARGHVNGSKDLTTSRYEEKVAIVPACESCAQKDLTGTAAAVIIPPLFGQIPRKTLDRRDWDFFHSGDQRPEDRPDAMRNPYWITLAVIKIEWDDANNKYRLKLRGKDSEKNHWDTSRVLRGSHAATFRDFEMFVTEAGGSGSDDFFFKYLGPLLLLHSNNPQNVRLDHEVGEGGTEFPNFHLLKQRTTRR